MGKKKKSIQYQQSFHVIQITKGYNLKKGNNFCFSQSGFNFDQNFPRNYHSIGDTASDDYLQNVFKLGFIHSIVANYYNKKILNASDIRYIRPLLEKIYLLYDNSPILQELSVLYQRSKIIEQKTEEIFLFMDRLNLTLTMYINLMISAFIDVNIHNIQDICYTISYDMLIFLFGIVKNNYYHSNTTSVDSFLYEIYPNLRDFTTGNSREQRQKFKKIDNIKKNILVTIFNDIILVDLTAGQELAYNSLIQL